MANCTNSASPFSCEDRSFRSFRIASNCYTISAYCRTRLYRKLVLTGIGIIPTYGSTESYPYVVPGCDRIVDMRVTGESLDIHDLVAFEPPLAVVSPVLVALKDKACIVRSIMNL